MGSTDCCTCFAWGTLMCVQHGTIPALISSLYADLSVVLHCWPSLRRPLLVCHNFLHTHLQARACKSPHTMQSILQRLNLHFHVQALHDEATPLRSLHECLPYFVCWQLVWRQVHDTVRILALFWASHDPIHFPTGWRMDIVSFRVDELESCSLLLRCSPRAHIRMVGARVQLLVV